MTFLFSKETLEICKNLQISWLQLVYMRLHFSFINRLHTWSFLYSEILSSTLIFNIKQNILKIKARSKIFKKAAQEIQTLDREAKVFKSLLALIITGSKGGCFRTFYCK